MFILAIGLTLNTKANLGVSPIISVPYSISQITGLNFGDLTFVVYAIFVVVQIIIHIRLKNHKRIPKFCAVGIYVENIFNNRVNIKLSGNCNMSDTILL